MENSQHTAAGEMNAETAAVARTTATLLSAVNASDVAGVLAVWSYDGVLMPPHHPSVRGRSAIERYFSELFERTRFTFSFTATTLHISGGTAFERVDYAALVPREEGRRSRRWARAFMSIAGNRTGRGSWRWTSGTVTHRRRQSGSLTRQGA